MKLYIIVNIVIKIYYKMPKDNSDIDATGNNKKVNNNTIERITLDIDKLYEFMEYYPGPYPSDGYKMIEIEPIKNRRK